jgi:hypothetical protein
MNANAVGLGPEVGSVRGPRGDVWTLHRVVYLGAETRPAETRPAGNATDEENGD